MSTTDYDKELRRLDIEAKAYVILGLVVIVAAGLIQWVRL